MGGWGQAGQYEGDLCFVVVVRHLFGIKVAVVGAVAEGPRGVEEWEGGGGEGGDEAEEGIEVPRGPDRGEEGALERSAQTHCGGGGGRDGGWWWWW